MKSETELFEDVLTEENIDEGNLLKTKLDINDFEDVMETITKKGEKIKKLYVDKDNYNVEITTNKAFYEIRSL